jgi:hypothetical protein
MLSRSKGTTTDRHWVSKGPVGVDGMVLMEGRDFPPVQELGTGKRIVMEFDCSKLSLSFPLHSPLSVETYQTNSRTPIDRRNCLMLDDT